LKAHKNDPYRQVTITCRGEGNLWLPAAISAIIGGDKALTVEGLETPALREEWDRLRRALRNLDIREANSVR
jgi:hypothetical protein